MEMVEELVDCTTLDKLDVGMFLIFRPRVHSVVPPEFIGEASVEELLEARLNLLLFNGWSSKTSTTIVKDSMRA